jgi:hypothetical protein
MKKILFVLLTATATLCQAQDADPRKKLYLGIKAGYNYSNVYDTQGETFEAKSKFGIAAGVFVSIPIGRHLGVQPEILFAQRGFHGTGTLLGSSYELTRTSSYLDLPVLIALKPNRFLTLVAGPQFSYLLKQNDVFTNSASSVQQEEEFNNDNIRRNMLCAIAGLDINLHPVVLGLRAGWDMQQNNGDGTSTTPRYKNAWFQGTFGFRF